MPPAPNEDPPSIGLIGFGAFGQLIAHHLGAHFRLQVFDPAWPAHGQATASGVVLTSLEAAARCPVVILAMPVAALGEMVAAIGPHLRPGALVLDVCSVKVEPARIMHERLPKHVRIVGTHPLFGPQSARDGIRGQRVAVCPVREGRSARRVAAFLRARLGLQVFLTTPEEHDREAATVQGLTHLIARMLVQMEPLPTRMTTASFELLMRAVEMVRHDSSAVFLAIEQANPYAAPVRERFFALADEMRASLGRAAE